MNNREMLVRALAQNASMRDPGTVLSQAFDGLKSELTLIIGTEHGTLKNSDGTNGYEIEMETVLYGVIGRLGALQNFVSQHMRITWDDAANREAAE